MDDYYENFYKYFSDAIYEIFIDEFNKSKQIQSTYNYLQNFQLIVGQMPLWNTPTCEKKWEFVCRHSGNDYLEEYMKIVLYTKMKTVLDSCFDDDKEISELIAQFKCPTKEEFLREVLTSCARNFYENPYLFKENRNIQIRIENSQKIKSTITDNIKFVIQKYLPSKTIIKKCRPENILKKKKVITNTIGLQCELYNENKIAQQYSDSQESLISDKTDNDIDLKFDTDNTLKNTTEQYNSAHIHQNNTLSNISNPDMLINSNPTPSANLLNEPNTVFFQNKQNENIKNYQELHKEYIDNQNPTPNQNIYESEKNESQKSEVITVSVPHHVMQKTQFQSPNLLHKSNSKSNLSRGTTSSSDSSSSDSSSSDSSSSDSSSSDSSTSDPSTELIKKKKKKSRKQRKKERKNREDKRDDKYYKTHSAEDLLKGPTEREKKSGSGRNGNTPAKSKHKATRNSNSHFYATTSTSGSQHSHSSRDSPEENAGVSRPKNRDNFGSPKKDKRSKNSYKKKKISHVSEDSRENTSSYDMNAHTYSTFSEYDKSSSYKEFTKTIENELNHKKKKPLFNFY
jgi:hypothetical protein